MNFQDFNELSLFVLKNKKTIKRLYNINQQMDEVEKQLLSLLWKIWNVTQSEPEIANEIFNEISYYVMTGKTFNVSLETFSEKSPAKEPKRKLSQREIATQLGLNQSDISKRLKKRQCIVRNFVGTQF